MNPADAEACASASVRVKQVLEPAGPILIAFAAIFFFITPVHQQLGVLALFLATGCARFESRPLIPAQTADAFARRSLSNPELKPFLEAQTGRQFPQWPIADWDLPLLTAAAWYYSPELEVARAQWTVSQAGVSTAGGRPNPTVTFGPGYNFDAARGLTPWMPFVNFDLPLETAGKRALRIAEAAGRSQVAGLHVRTTAWQVRSRVRAAYLDAAAAAAREKLLQAQMTTREEVTARMEERVKAGALARSELNPPRIGLARAHAELTEARRQLAGSRAALAEALGVPLAALQGVSLPGDPRARPAPGGELATAPLREIALQSRSDVLEALHEYAAAETALRLELAKQYPDLHVSPGFQWDQGENKWQLGIALELPLLNRNQGPIAEAEARRTEAAARFNALQGRVLAEIDRAASLYAAEKENVAALQSLAAAHRTRLVSVQVEVEAGATDTLELLNTRLEMQTVELLDLEARLRLQQALGSLEDSLQHSFDPAGERPPS